MHSLIPPPFLLQQSGEKCVSIASVDKQKPTWPQRLESGCNLESWIMKVLNNTKKGNPIILSNKVQCRKWYAVNQVISGR